MHLIKSANLYGDQKLKTPNMLDADKNDENRKPKDANLQGVQSEPFSPPAVQGNVLEIYVGRGTNDGDSFINKTASDPKGGGGRDWKRELANSQAAIHELKETLARNLENTSQRVVLKTILSNGEVQVEDFEDTLDQIIKMPREDEKAKEPTEEEEEIELDGIGEGGGPQWKKPERTEFQKSIFSELQGKITEKKLKGVDDQYIIGD
eukprot:Trichotokara_eunicae@DN5537_c0_g1_i1.p1